MSATTVIAELRSRGLLLWVLDGQLQVRPKALIAQADREAIRTHLPEIIDLLAPTSGGVGLTETTPVPPAAVPWDLVEATRLLCEADALADRLAVGGHPALVAAAATVASAFAMRDMETLRFAMAEFNVEARTQREILLNGGERPSPFLLPMGWPRKNSHG